MFISSKNLVLGLGGGEGVLGGSGDSFATQLGPTAFDVPPAVFTGNGITFEYESDPGKLYEATLVDVTLFMDGFESGNTDAWSLRVD